MCDRKWYNEIGIKFMGLAMKFKEHVMKFNGCGMKFNGLGMKCNVSVFPTEAIAPSTLQ